MKKIMILGGGKNQLNLLKTAKNCGYYVVLCDRDINCIGKTIADVFYNSDIVDSSEMSKIAQLEQVDGVVSNSETIMEVVATVTSKLGLRGNSRESIAILNSKEKFRRFQKENGLFSPNFFIANDVSDYNVAINKLNFPIIVKPVKCSGTRGTIRFDYFEKDKIESAIEKCIDYSRNKRCEIEEYIEMPSLTVLEGDVFVNDGKFFWGGLYFTQRSRQLPMVPMTYMSPYIDSEYHMVIIKETLTKTLINAGIKHGQYNVEAYFDMNDNFFIIEINARQGGHGLPEYVKLATGIDMDRLLLTTAVKDDEYFNFVISSNYEQKYATRHTVFSDFDGRLEALFVDNRVRPYVVQIEMEYEIGDLVKKRIDGSSYIGFVNLVFDTYESQHYFSERMEDYIYPIIKTEG